MVARTGITHYAWPGGLAAVVEGPASGTAAVFGPGGWRIGPARAVLPGGPPSGAEMVHLALPEALADQVATSLQLVGSSIHTDFVHLDRLVARLQADATDAMLFVLGRAPAALVLSASQVTVVEPRHEPIDEVLTGADGWIVIGLGKVSAPAPPGTFGRFPSDARFVLARGGTDRLPADVSAQITEAAGDARPNLMALLDGAHTLSQIAAATRLAPGAVVAVIEILTTHRLVFRYVSRVRPATGASTPG